MKLNQSQAFRTNSNLINMQTDIHDAYNTPSSNLYGVRWRFLVFRFQPERSDTIFTIYSNTVECFRLL
jgi:hypothetical protein